MSEEGSGHLCETERECRNIKFMSSSAARCLAKTAKANSHVNEIEKRQISDRMVSCIPI